MPRTAPVCNPVCFNKSIFKVVSTSSLRLSKPICDSNVPPSKPVSASSFRTGKPISNRNVRPSKTVSASSVSPGKPICASNVSLSEHVSTIIFHPSKPIIGSNVRSSKPVSNSSVCSSKPIFGSSVRGSKPIRTINVCASKPVSEHVRVSDVRPSEPISSSHTRSSNIVSASNIRPSKTVSASNVCLGNPVCTNYVRPSRAICGSKVCQSSDSNIRHTDLINTSNALPSKPIRSNHICFVNSSLPTQQISYIFLLSLLAFSVYYKYSIFKLNIFINLFLVIMTKSTCFRKCFVLYISRSSTFSRSNLNTYIAFRSFRTILLLNTSEISFSYKGLCIFAILSINSFNFPKSNVQRIFFQNIFKKIGNVLRIFIFIFFVPVIWQFNAFCITVFFTVIIIMILALVFIVFTALFVNVFIKLSYIIGIFTHFSISICINFLRIVLRIFYYFMFGCLFLLVFAWLLCVFVNVSHVSYLFTDLNDYDSSSGSIFFSIFMIILTKMLIAFKVIITSLQKIFGFFFQPRFYF